MGGSNAPWDIDVIACEGTDNLVSIGREGRLRLQTHQGSVRVGLTIVDEASLALVDLSLRAARDLTIVYPAPAGDVSVLLAAQILIGRLIMGNKRQSVGIVTNDATDAARIFEQLTIAATGTRAQICEVFTCARTDPNGVCSDISREFRGVIIGRRFADWPVDVVIVDHLAGPINANPTVPTIRIFADPLDREIKRLVENNTCTWGWSESDLSLMMAEPRPNAITTAPFSVITDRLTAMSRGIEITIHVAHHEYAETLLKRLRDDLRTLSDFAGPKPSPSVLRGINTAWSHMNTLVSLPCRPSSFDRFAGIPPLAAWSTQRFEPEIAAWAGTLDGDMRDVAEVIASDLGELRDVLEEANPFGAELRHVIADDNTLIILRTKTAANGLEDEMRGKQVVNASLVPLSRLHRMGTFDHAVAVGSPAKWDLHRLDSGLTPNLHVLVFGDLDAYFTKLSLEGLHNARVHWASAELKKRVWEEVLGTEPPPEPTHVEVSHEIITLDAYETTPEIDPFESLKPLLASVPMSFGDEGIEESLAIKTSGVEWQGAVEAVRVDTEAGTIILPRNRWVEVRSGEEIEEVKADALKPGMLILVDRAGGRLGLLEALADKLKRVNPDLIAANALASNLRMRIHDSFIESGMTTKQLFERLCDRGFQKIYQTARSYVEDYGPLAPRDFDDLERLADALGLVISPKHLRQAYAGVTRWRTFRRAAGKALVAASHQSVSSSESTRVDPDTGFSVADLQELILEARVIEVSVEPEPVPVVEIGRIQLRSWTDGNTRRVL